MTDDNTASPPAVSAEEPTTSAVGAATSSDAPKRQFFKFNDDVIAMVRELIQLSLLTGTNIVDHMRAIVVEVSPEDPRFLAITPEYISAYNSQVEELNKRAQAEMLEMQGKLALDEETETNKN